MLYMVNSLSSNSPATTSTNEDTSLLSSTHNIHYSSILDQQSTDYANSISAALDESCLHEQDNESIRRRARRSSSCCSFIHHQQQKFTTTISSSQNTTVLSHHFWQSIVDRYSTSVYLENKGSVARDHLANERTYLAWLRTSLSIVSVGIGITQLFRLERTMVQHPPPGKQQNSLIQGQTIGLVFIIISILFLIFAFIRYFHTQVALVKGFFPASRSTVVISSGLLFITMILMLIAVVSR